MDKGNKISIIGAGNVGSLLALRILEHDMADIILLDIDEDISKAKAYDLQDASPTMGYEKNVEATSDYSKIRDSNIVVITAGFPRKGGMTREELIQKNGSIVKQVAVKIKEFAPQSIIIVVTNPLDVMSYLAYKISGFDRCRVLGMAGVLDSSRCSNLVAEELGVMKSEVDCIVVGSHDKNMLPLLNYSKAQGQPLKKVLNETQQDKIIEKTKKRGTEIVSLLKSGSAFFAPSAACFSMIKAILNNEHITMCVSVYLDGEYGLKNIFIGMPVILGKDGIEKIVEPELSEDETVKLQKSAEIVKDSIHKLKI